MGPARAYAAAGAAIALWGSLAAVSSRLAHLPALLTTGFALCVGGLVGLARAGEWRVPLPTLAAGVGGIFGYHALLFAAFRRAPVVEANLVNYLWPLLIVVLSPVVLPRYRLRPMHAVGVLLGLCGAGLAVTGGSLHPDLAALPGYLLAAGAALTWALYSLLTKRLPAFGSGAVGAFCLYAGALALGLHAAMAGSGGFTALRAADLPLLLALGVGPMGAAFYLWDFALKRGDPRVIGSLSYVTPLLSTSALALAAERPVGPLALAALVLVVAGAATGSLGSRTRRREDTREPAARRSGR